MSTPNKISNTELNKHYYLSSIKSELVVLLQKSFPVNFFAVNNRKKLMDTLLLQVNDSRSIISVRIECFQNNREILRFMEYISEEERVESIKRTLEPSFKHDLSDRIVFIDYSNSIFNQGGNFY